jgi:hypothetical protein
MPSPFPGMDPYLEALGLWPDFHHRLATEISIELNTALPSPYYAQLEMRQELGIVEEGGVSQRIIPDVTVVRHPQPSARAGAAVLDRPRRDLSKAFEYIVHLDPVQHHFVEIRDSARGHKLITLIEILSPSNKRPGPDREAYQRKQREVLDSDANLIEFDLLRTGERILPDPNLDAILHQIDPPPHYLVLVNRAWRRGGAVAYQVFPCGLREWLPCIPVPLKQGEPEVPLDLQFVFNRAYDGGPYRRGAVNYSQPPQPPLSEPDAAWAEQWLRSQG